MGSAGAAGLGCFQVDVLALLLWALIFLRVTRACSHGEAEEGRKQGSVTQKGMACRIRTATVKFCCSLEVQASLEFVRFK